MTATRNGSLRRVRAINGASRRLPREERRQLILEAAETQFAGSGFGSTTTVALAEAAGVCEPVLYSHFTTKRELFEEVIERNSKVRLAALQESLSAIPDVPPVECVKRMAELTVQSCVEGAGNALITSWGLLELPEFTSNVYRAEIGATEVLWCNEFGSRFSDSELRRRLAVHLVPYSVHACMAFGIWLATLRHKPETARAHALLFAGGIEDAAQTVLKLSSEALEEAGERSPG